MKWEPGRQNAKYEKLVLCKLSFFDINIIKIPTGTRIPWHVDIIPRKKHYRLNIELVKPKIGGKFMGKTIFQIPRITLIRPDRDMHAVTEIFEGHALILSIGFAIAK